MPTNSGWGIFWLRQDPGATHLARLYYAHVDFNGQITVGPLLVVGIPQDRLPRPLLLRGLEPGSLRAADRQPGDALLLQPLARRRRCPVSAPSARRCSSPPSSTRSPTAISTPTRAASSASSRATAAGHSCSYAFKLDANGTPNGSVINLVDFDFTHQFYPRAAFDGAGFAILSVKDIEISGGGVMTKYWPLSGTISHARQGRARQAVPVGRVPRHRLERRPLRRAVDRELGALDTAPWQIHFASFRRTKPASTLIAERVIDMVAQKTNHRWTTQVHAVGADWVAQYASRTANNSIIAVYELLGDDAPDARRRRAVPAQRRRARLQPALRRRSRRHARHRARLEPRNAGHRGDVLYPAAAGLCAVARSACVTGRSHRRPRSDPAAQRCAHARSRREAREARGNG